MHYQFIKVLQYKQAHIHINNLTLIKYQFEMLNYMLNLLLFFNKDIQLNNFLLKMVKIQIFLKLL